MLNAKLALRGYAQVATFPSNVKYQDLFLKLYWEVPEAGWGVGREDRARRESLSLDHL